MRRLDQLLSNLGYCSRSEAKVWLKSGRVTVGGKAALDPSMRCEAGEVRVEGEALDHAEGLLILMNKPAGVVCSHNRSEGRRIYDLLPERWQNRTPALTTVGRLDRETTGLVLITDQMDFVHQLTSPRKSIPKLYRVRLEADAAAVRREEVAKLFASGDFILPGERDPCLPADLAWQNGREATLTLTEGRYHQVRRMFAAHSLAVAELHRESFGDYKLGDLAIGEWVTLSIPR